MESQFFAVLGDPRLVEIAACLIVVGILGWILSRTSTLGHDH